MVRFARPGWWLVLLVGGGSPVAAQANVPPPRVELKENYPNPFFPATTIRSRFRRRSARGDISRWSA